MNPGATLLLLFASAGVGVADPGSGPSYFMLSPEPFEASPWSLDPEPLIGSSTPTLAPTFDAEPL